MGNKRNVQVIPATRNPYSSEPIAEKKKRKVAAYARVSTDFEEQQTSFNAQVSYYSDYIREHDDWEFVEVYTDDGISGTSTKHRAGFNRMVKDALDGKIDLIVTKSVSRFARNTVDSLTTIRALKEHGVECYFQKENIWTFDSKSELLLSFMSSLAQEESRSISQNCTWGQRKRFADGGVSVAYSRFLGYDRGENGEWVINEEQAKVVKEIYRLFLEGLSYQAIANRLTDEGIETPSHKKKWPQSTVRSILTNEKYKGDALLQKNYTVDFLTKKQKKNEGELKKYYLSDHHPAIISSETFEIVQAEVARRSRKKQYNGVSIFSSKIRCEDCGGWYAPKVWHSNDQYRKVIWQCGMKYKGEKPRCKTPHYTEEQIKSKFVEAMNSYTKDKADILLNMKEARRVIQDTSELELKKKQKEDEQDAVIEMIQNLVDENASMAIDQNEYRKEYDELFDRSEKVKTEVEQLSSDISSKLSRGLELGKQIAQLEKLGDSVTDFSENLWGVFLEEAVAHRNGTMTFKMWDGREVMV